MKLICNCGNEAEFVEKQNDFDENGIYTTLDWEKFDHWSEHDESGFKCEKCGKEIYFFS